jgi:hypothetical protein
LGHFHTERKRHFLRKWYKRALNSIHENYTRNNLLEAKTKFKREQKYFYIWRKAFMMARKRNLARVEAARILTNIVGGKSQIILKRSLCKWRDFVETKQAQENFIYAVSERKHAR